MSILDTMGTTMAPKNIRVEKYDIWSFKCRVDHLNNIPRSELTKPEISMILSNFMIHIKCEFLLENDIKNLKLQKNAQTHSNIQIMRATRHLKAQTSYFSTRIFLGTIVVPMISKNDLHSVEFLNKNFYLTYK